MKKTLLALALICMVIISCKKDHASFQHPTNGLHKVSFKVGFSQQITDLSTSKLKVNSTAKKLADITPADITTTMYFAVYDSSGHQVTLTKQVSTDADFGTFSDNLHAGNYTVVVAAGQDGFLLSKDIIAPFTHGAYDMADSSKLSTDIISYGFTDDSWTELNPFKETFYKKVSLTVSNEDSDQNITIDRVTSAETVNIEDAIPAGASKIKLNVKLVSNKFYIGSGTAKSLGTPGFNYTATLAPGDIGTTGYNFTVMFLPYTTPTTNTIYCTSATGSTGDIAKRVINNVTYAPNTATLLTGSLFGGSAPDGVHFSADTIWSGTITKSF